MKETAELAAWGRAEQTRVPLWCLGLCGKQQGTLGNWIWAAADDWSCLNSACLSLTHIHTHTHTKLYSCSVRLLVRLLTMFTRWPSTRGALWSASGHVTQAQIHAFRWVKRCRREGTVTFQVNKQVRATSHCKLSWSYCKAFWETRDKVHFIGSVWGQI